MSPQKLTAAGHVPVMPDEVVTYLITRRDGVYIDGTVGLGGHAEVLLAQLEKQGLVIGIDLDREALEKTANRLAHYGKRFIPRHSSYQQFPMHLRELKVIECHGILLDLGLSSFQLSTDSRGFSFQEEGPLDMRFDTSSGKPLSAHLLQLSVKDIAKILREFGDVPSAYRFARTIHERVHTGLMATTRDLAQSVEEWTRRESRIKTLAKVFQAFRIYVNDELTHLEKTVELGVNWLASGGRIVVLSYHSLEDRIVKHFFQRESHDCICPPKLPACICGHKATLRLLTKKPVLPSPVEVHNNPRSRTAKLRGAERL